MGISDHRILIPLEGRLVILPAANQPQPLLEDWPWPSAVVWLASKSDNSGIVYLGGPPDMALPDGTGQTTGPVSTASSEKGYPVPVGEDRRLPGNVSELWVAGTENDVLLFILFPPSQG